MFAGTLSSVEIVDALDSFWAEWAKHDVRLDPLGARIAEIRKWLSEQKFTGRYARGWSGGKAVYLFEEISDALLFQLTWG